VNKDEFLARVQAAGAFPSLKEAELRSKVVASALAGITPDAETRRHFATQLPGFLKSHLLAERPRSLRMTPDAFLQHIGRALRAHVPEARRTLRAVYGILKAAVADGEIADFEARIPKDIAALLRR